MPSLPAHPRYLSTEARCCANAAALPRLGLNTSNGSERTPSNYIHPVPQRLWRPTDRYIDTALAVIHACLLPELPENRPRAGSASPRDVADVEKHRYGRVVLSYCRIAWSICFADEGEGGLAENRSALVHGETGREPCQLRTPFWIAYL